MLSRPSLPRLARHARPAALVALCSLTFGSCGDTVQDQSIGPSPLETVIVKSRFPVYWLGLKFLNMRLTSVYIDPGGAVTIKYGDCVVGGQYTCVTPVSIVTSPNNSFVPGGAAAAQAIHLRGAAVTSSEGGKTLALSTGGVVVSVYANHPSLAEQAVGTMAPLNKVGLPEATLPTAVANTGFERVPLPSQVPAGEAVPRPPGQ